MIPKQNQNNHSALIMLKKLNLSCLKKKTKTWPQMNMKGPTVIWSSSFNVNYGLNKDVEKNNNIKTYSLQNHLSSKVAVPSHEPWLCTSAFLSDTVGLSSAGFRGIHSWMGVQYEKHQKKHTRQVALQRLLVWDLNCLVAIKFFSLQATESKTLICLLQICNDKNLGMNHLPKRYTSTLGLVRSHWNIF